MIFSDSPSISPVKKRNFLPDTLVVDRWETIAGYYKDLQERNITDVEQLRQWLIDRSELESAVQEDVAWRYIHMSCDTASKEYSDAFNYFVSEIEPKIAPF